MRRFKMNQLSMPGHCKKDSKEHELILRILKGIVSCRTLVIARRYKETERGLLPGLSWGFVWGWMRSSARHTRNKATSVRPWTRTRRTTEMATQEKLNLLQMKTGWNDIYDMKWILWITRVDGWLWSNMKQLKPWTAAQKPRQGSLWSCPMSESDPLEIHSQVLEIKKNTSQRDSFLIPSGTVSSPRPSF